MRLLSCLLLLALLTGCRSAEEPRLDRVWLFEAVDFTQQEETSQTDFRSEYYNPMNLSQETFLNLRQDGTYTSYLGTFEEGKWVYKDEHLVLKTREGKIIPFACKSLKDGKLVLFYSMRNALYTFNGYDNHFARREESPFIYENNTWRAPARHRESREELAERLRNHFAFFERYMAWMADKEVSRLNEQLPGPLQRYDNGFELIHPTRQPNEWTCHFYDTTDSRRAYEMIYYLLAREDLDWSHRENRRLMYQSAYRQLKEKIN